MFAKRKWSRMIFRLIAILAVPYLVLLAGVFLSQRRFLYHPSQSTAEVMLKNAAGCGLQPWRNLSGLIIGWHQLTTTNRAQFRILILHGNAGDAVDRIDYAQSLKPVADCDVFILEYPGYGARPGSPSQTSLCDAADEAILLLEKDGPIYLIGESLGTGVAAYLAGRHPQAVSGVLLIAPYHNMTDVAQHHMPIFPVRWMLWDRFPAAAFLQPYHGPVAVLLAGRDEVIPNQFGRRLFEGYSGPKKVWTVPDAYHNDLPDQPASWWRELTAFWQANQPAQHSTH